jgi:hypothetical protein
MTMLEALPSRSWNMIYQRALTLGVHRQVNTLNTIPQNVTIEDLNVIPDRETALQLALFGGVGRFCAGGGTTEY